MEVAGTIKNGNTNDDVTADDDNVIDYEKQTKLFLLLRNRPVYRKNNSLHLL